MKVTGLAALSPEEQRQLQQEMRELETLVAGYQKENERLCADLKAAQQALRAAGILLSFVFILYVCFFSPSSYASLMSRRYSVAEGYTTDASGNKNSAGCELSPLLRTE